MVAETSHRISRKLGKELYEHHCRIYFIEAPSIGLVKIGYTLKVPERFRSMLTMCPVPLSLLADMPGGPQAEAKLHDRFEAHRRRRDAVRPGVAQPHRHLSRRGPASLSRQAEGW